MYDTKHIDHEAHVIYTMFILYRKGFITVWKSYLTGFRFIVEQWFASWFSFQKWYVMCRIGFQNSIFLVCLFQTLNDMICMNFGFFNSNAHVTLHKKSSFSLRISLVNVNESAANLMENYIFCARVNIVLVGLLKITNTSKWIFRFMMLDKNTFPLGV